MNIYEKIQAVKEAILNENLKKSGQNKFAGYTYYELSDFLPTIIQKCNENKLFTQILFDNEVATLVIINTEKIDEKIEYTSPMKELDLKGCNQVQALGGVETYQRRYLYMNAFDIVENDMFDSVQDTKTTTTTDTKTKATTNTDVISEAQRKRLFTIGKGNDAIIKQAMRVLGYEHTKDIKKTDYDEICKQVKKTVTIVNAMEGVAV